MGSQGFATQLALDSIAFDSSSEKFRFVSCDLSESTERVFSEGIRGSRSRHGTDEVDGITNITGSVVFEPSPQELDLLLSRILGGSETTDNFPVADTLPTFLLMIDRVAKVQTYSGCVVSRAVFSGTTGGLVTLTLDLIAKTVSTGNAGSFQSGLSYLTDSPYVFHQGVLDIASTEYKISSFELVIDNLVTAQFNNTQTASDLDPTDRQVTLSVDSPYTSSETALTAVDGAAATLTMTNGGVSTTFNLASLEKSPFRLPVATRGELRLNSNWNCRRTASTAEISIDNDITP